MLSIFRFLDPSRISVLDMQILHQLLLGRRQLLDKSSEVLVVTEVLDEVRERLLGVLLEDWILHEILEQLIVVFGCLL